MSSTDPAADPEAESGGTEFFDRTYGTSSDELIRSVREATFGEDIGQFSWTTADEQRGFHRLLGIDANTAVLEIASGAGGPALFLVRSTGCRLVGLDLHDAGVAAANATAAREGLTEHAAFLVHDAREPLPFDADSFDAIISIDSINHVFARAPVFAEWLRVLRPGGRILYTDAVVVTGPLLREEILMRSPAMGEFVFTPAGADELLLRAAGFADVVVQDVTDTIVAVTGAWRRAREEVSDRLDEVEGAEANATFQQFLAAVHMLAAERRLSRFAYSARKPPR